MKKIDYEVDDVDKLLKIFEDNAPKKPSYIGHRKRVNESFASDRDCETKSPQDMLERILMDTNSVKDTKPIAKELLNTFGSLAAIMYADPSELMKINGIGAKTAHLLTFIPAFFRKAEEARAHVHSKIDNAVQAAEYLVPNFTFKKHEVAFLLSMDIRNKVVSCDLLSNGSEGQVQISTDRIANIMRSCGAIKAIIAHNHPSGDLTPSSSDIQVTARLILGLSYLDRILVDHLIIGENGYFTSLMSVSRDQILDTIKSGSLVPSYMNSYSFRKKDNTAAFVREANAEYKAELGNFISGLIKLNSRICKEKNIHNDMTLDSIMNFKSNFDNVLDCDEIYKK